MIRWPYRNEIRKTLTIGVCAKLMIRQNICKYCSDLRRNVCWTFLSGIGNGEAHLKCVECLSDLRTCLDTLITCSQVVIGFDQILTRSSAGID